MAGSQSVDSRISEWQTLQSLGRTPATQRFHREIVNTIRKHFPNRDKPAESVTDQVVQDFALRVTHYCPSRWNAILTVLCFVTPRAAQLKRRRQRFREFNPPTQLQFFALLAECDKLPKSKAGLMVRLLALTGLRFGEAKRLRWENVHADRIEVTARSAKGARARSVPFLPGTAIVLERLRGLANGSPLVLRQPNVRRGVLKACQRAGVKFLSYHGFRHLFATRCIESGVDAPTVARWLGHQDGGALLSRMYFHLLDEHSRAMAARVKII